MHTIVSKAQNTNSAQTHIHNTGPLDFLTGSVLAFSRSHSGQELDQLLDDFFQPELVDYLIEHSDIFTVLSMAWSANIRRIVFSQNNVVFPNKLLLLPPLYQGLGWTDRQNKEWDAVYCETLNRYEQTPALNEAILLLFLDGMRTCMEEAVFLFHARLQQIGQGSEVYDSGMLLLEELYQYGWPRLNSNATLM